MNCREMEVRIALQVSGDMDPRDERSVIEHLAKCESCARLAAELRADLEEMQALRADPADETALAGVRLSVLAELESRRARTLSPLAWILASSNLRWAAAAGVVLLAAIAGLRHADDTGAPPGKIELVGKSTVPPEAALLIPKVAKQQQAPTRPEAAPIRAAAPRLVHTARPDPSTVQSELPAPVPENQALAKHVEIVDSNANGSLLSAPATLVKLKSSDPDVVLYWLVESNGG